MSLEPTTVEWVLQEADPRIPLIVQHYPMGTGILCEAQSPAPDAGWICTRSQAHNGPHVAHGSTVPVCAWWPGETPAVSPRRVVAHLLTAVLDGRLTLVPVEEPWDGVGAGNVTFHVSDGTLLTIFNDCGDYDYVDRLVRPDGTVWTYQEIYGQRPDEPDALTDVEAHSQRALTHLCASARRPDGVWHPLDTAPTDGTLILVWAPGYSGLPPMYSLCAYHPDAGFCIDELRYPSHWRPLPPPPG